MQDALLVEYEQSTELRAWQGSMVVGILQTPDYARHVFARMAELQQSPRDIEDAVRAHVRRQELLYQPGRQFRLIMWEAALLAGLAPPDVLATQMDRLTSVIGLDTVRLGVVPIGAPLAVPPGNGFWLYDDRLAIVEEWHVELWLNDTDSVALYRRVWETLDKAAVYGTQARRIIGRVRVHFADLA